MQSTLPVAQQTPSRTDLYCIIFIPFSLRVYARVVCCFLSSSFSSLLSSSLLLFFFSSSSLLTEADGGGGGEEEDQRGHWSRRFLLSISPRQRSARARTHTHTHTYTRPCGYYSTLDESSSHSSSSSPSSSSFFRFSLIKIRSFVPLLAHCVPIRRTARIVCFVNDRKKEKRRRRFISTEIFLVD